MLEQVAAARPGRLEERGAARLEAALAAGDPYDEVGCAWAAGHLLADIYNAPDIFAARTALGRFFDWAAEVKDVCSRRIVGYAIGPRMTSQLAGAALRTAIARRRPTGTVFVHSDRGGQFRSRRYQRSLRAHGLIGSMGRVSSAGDNAAMESFFALLQKNVLNRQAWTSREQLRLAVIFWIERTYHRRRRQRALGRLTPIEFEALIGNTDLAQAA